jgi:hypothetical protein
MAAKHLVLLLEQPQPPAQLPELGLLVTCRARPRALVTVGLGHRVRQARLGDPEVRRDVLDPHTARRLGLIERAERHDGLLIEDDYDAEHRYDHHAVGTLHGIAPDRASSWVAQSRRPWHRAFVSVDWPRHRR